MTRYARGNFGGNYGRGYWGGGPFVGGFGAPLLGGFVGGLLGSSIVGGFGGPGYRQPYPYQYPRYPYYNNYYPGGPYPGYYR